MSDTLNECQQRAFDEILAANQPGCFHLLTGHAGAGKTFLVQHLARVLTERKVGIVLTAPTHKAVAVLARKLQSSGVHIPCATIHSLLSLAPKPRGDRLVFERKKHAQPVMADVVVIDECSMISLEMMRHIRRHLPVSFVLFVGDPAQLPPVGEEASQTFGTKSHSHLETIVRQGAGNPILDAADIIRSSQGGALDWSWCKPARAVPLGVYVPSVPDEWMKDAFTSKEFAADADTFRYLCWTNERVASVNAKVRRWIYGGKTPTPFMPGERALVRGPVLDEDGKTPLLMTNEEATVVSIREDNFIYPIRHIENADGWNATVPSWSIEMTKDDGQQVEIHIPRDERTYNKVLARIAEEAADNRQRWGDHHGFKQRMAKLQAVYALTVHTSQGSTIKHCFMDVADIRRRAASNPLECQQLCYVAATRPTHTLTLIGV